MDENGNVDNVTVANALGRFTLEVRKPRVKIYAWLDFDGDGKLSYGDLYGYYGYGGGNPVPSSPTVLTLGMSESKNVDFNVAPYVDSSNRPELSAQDMQILTNYKRSIVEKHYLELKNR